MKHRVSLALVAVAVVAEGCTTVDNAPPTAPTTTRATTSTTIPATKSTSTTASPSTTIDRFVEITAIFEDLERRRLQAIYTGDQEAFLALFADTPYRERSLEVFDHVAPGPVPEITIEILDVLRDDTECLAVWATGEVDDRPIEAALTVLTRSDREWGIAYVTTDVEGWICDGPHPLSS
jgi:hypothetical protein